MGLADLSAGVFARHEFGGSWTGGKGGQGAAGAGPEQRIDRPKPAGTTSGNDPTILIVGRAEATRSPFLRRRQLLAKRILDLLLAPVALLLLLPLLLMAAIAVLATSPGPVLFRQRRLGWNGRPFTILKFRTVYVDRADPTGLAQIAQGDGRVTPVGRFLRRSTIDELPQLVNVILGQMSLVGPRPHVPGMQAAGTDYRLLAPDYNRRLEMPPGITGWAQANGLRGPVDDAASARARIDFDLAYVRDFSIFFDLKILFMTLVELSRSGRRQARCSGERS